MKKKQVKALLDAVQPFAQIAPFYDMRQDKVEDTETISVGHWIDSAIRPLGQDFSAACAFKLADFRRLAQAFVAVQRDLKKKPKAKKAKAKKRNRV